MERYEGAQLAQLRKLTINQIQLLNHASTVNHERSDEYSDWKRQFKDEDGPKVKVRASKANDLSEMPSEAAFGMMMPR
jgi:hypothetical protein